MRVEMKRFVLLKSTLKRNSPRALFVLSLKRGKTLSLTKADYDILRSCFSIATSR